MLWGREMRGAGGVHVRDEGMEEITNNCRFLALVMKAW